MQEVVKYSVTKLNYGSVLLANRSVDRIDKKKKEHDPLEFWGYSTESNEQSEIVLEITGDTPADWHDETGYAFSDVD